MTELGTATRRRTLAAEGLLETLIDRLPVGVVLLDREGRVVLFNAYEERLAMRRREDVVGKPFFERVAPCTDVQELAGAFRAHIAHDTLDVTTDFKFKLEYLPRPRDVRIALRSFRAGRDVFAAFMVEDQTERRRQERAQDEFYSVLIHDLRGDLAGALGYAALLSDGSLGPLTDRQLEGAQTIREAGRRMNDRIAAALRERRARQTGLAPARREPVNVHALVLASLAMARPAAKDRGIALIYETSDEEFPRHALATLGDVDRLGALVDNLVTNALKYARARVVVALTIDGDELRLEVRDDGRGIAAQYRELVFEGGFQAPGSAPGHGLGLYSVRETAEAHGGRVWAESAREGGASLQVRLPAHRAEG